MSLLALDNILNNDILKERFHNIPEIKAAEILLKEKVPENITFEREVDISIANNKKLEKEDFIPRIFKGNKGEDQRSFIII
jgi:hypothetical protein